MGQHRRKSVGQHVFIGVDKKPDRMAVACSTWAGPEETQACIEKMQANETMEDAKEKFI